MGCSSSAPNMASPAPSPSTNSGTNLKISKEKGKKQIEEVDEIIYADKENETNTINVLPSCDNLGESTQLARNNKSFVDAPSSELEKDIQANGHVMEHDEKDDTVTSNADDAEMSDDLKAEDKLSKLEEVVEKVVELLVADTASESALKELSNSVEVRDKNDDVIILTKTLNEVTTDPNNEKDDLPEEIASPSQSECSRATRWEALADIAAELPPSLAVDPLTGQIYALSK